MLHLDTVYADTIYRRLHIEGNTTRSSNFVWWPDLPDESQSAQHQPPNARETYHNYVCTPGKTTVFAEFVIIVFLNVFLKLMICS